MILVILPLGKEAKEVTTWVVRVVMYTIASILGASAMALALGSAGQGLKALFPGLQPEWVVGFLGVVSLVFALQELNIVHMPMPQLKWLVPKEWMRRSRLVGNTLYGFVLGAGIFTFIPFASFYLLLLWEIAAGMYSLQAAVLLGVIYGGMRGIPAVLGGISMLRGVYPMPVSNWLIQRLGLWHAINALALLLVAGFLLGSLF